MADGRHIENHFLAITRLHIVQLRRNLEIGSSSWWWKCHISKINPTWRTAAILIIVIAPYLSRESSEFDEIWYAHVNIE